MPRNKNPNIKGPNVQHEYTFEQLVELRKCKLDPCYFISKYVKIQHPKHGIVPFKLRPYQEKMLRGYQNNRFTVVLSARQTGKALCLNTPIATPTGWTTMGEIQRGDFVLDADGKPVEVEAISDVMYEHVCYEVKFDTGDSIIADADHLWEVTDEYTKTKKILTTQNMVDTNYVNAKNQARYTVKVTKPIELPEANLRIDPYILGVWLGDGNSRNSEIIFHENDAEILEDITPLYDTYNRGSGINRDHLRTLTLYGLRTQLQTYGLIQNKHIPIEYRRASFGQRLALLQGLMDTDGTVDPMLRGQCDITLANETLARDVYQLVASLGLKPSFKFRQVGGFNRWEIKFSAYRSEIQVFRLKRKLDLMKSMPSDKRKNSTKKRSIQSIAAVPSVPVKCIRVKNDNHLFLAGHAMIPTHNSVTSGAYLLWYATFHRDKTVLIASNKNSNAMEMIHRIRLGYENLPMWLKPGIKDDGWNKHSVGFDNGTRIISEATSENSGRGLSISLLYLDEFAHVAKNIQEEFWTSIEPTLSTGGDCIMTSTPNGDIDIFAQIWRGALVKANGFFPVEVKWDEPPGRDAKFKEETIGRIGEQKWKQEYECDFLSSDALLVSSIKLAEVTTRLAKIQPKFVINEVIFWYDVKPGGTYLVGVDPATGTGKDFTVITVYQFPAMRQVAEYRSNTMSPNDSYKVLKNILLYLEERGTMVYFSVENNGVGEGIISLFEADENSPTNSEFVSEEGKGKRGFFTTARSKMKACVNFKEMFEKDNIQITSPILLQELKTFVRTRGAYDHLPGSTSDCIAATLTVIRLVEEIATYDQNAFDKLYSTTGFEQWDTGNIEYNEGSEADAPMPFI